MAVARKCPVVRVSLSDPSDWTTCCVSLVCFTALSVQSLIGSLPSSVCIVCTSVDIGASAKLELVDKFCYLGDMLSVDGDADAAVKARIRIGWNKFGQLVPLLTNKDVSLIMRGRLYSSCVRSSMLHGSETWGPIFKTS